MSKDAGLYLKFNKFNAICFINILKDLGWSFNDCGKKSYLPIGDCDYDWVWDDLSDEEVLEIIKQKTTLNESIGIVMTWKDTNIGGNFIINDRDIIFSININQVFIKNTNNLIDVSWYIERLIYPIEKSDEIQLSSFRYEEFL